MSISSSATGGHQLITAQDRSMSHLQGKLEAAMIKANREAQAKTVPWWHGPGPSSH